MSEAEPVRRKAPARVLVVDDEPNARSALVELLQEEGYEVEGAEEGRAALRRLEAFDPDVVLTDLKMPGLDGIGLLERGRHLVPHAVFVVMTAFGSIETAVEAIKKGAENYLSKPLDLDAVVAIVERSAERARVAREAAAMRQRLHERYAIQNILGEHPRMRRLLATVAQVAESRATVLVHGESGTGKELIAAAIHHGSARREGPFVTLNCAALAESLLESELFGHERGAFTGAASRRRGRFELADGGTLFLDEVGELPPSVQVKLLRFLQERTFERVGGNRTIEVDVRVVAATHRDLRELVAEGRFREDLYYRLDVVRIEVPPLRERASDIPLLAHHFLFRFAQENDRPAQRFSPAALQALKSYPWPGNVRELQNAIERAVVLCEGEQVGTEHLPPQVLEQAASEPQLLACREGMTLAEIERVAILATLEACGGSTSEAARRLGISRRKIQYRLKAWGIDASRWRTRGTKRGDPG